MGVQWNHLNPQGVSNKEIPFLLTYSSFAWNFLGFLLKRSVLRVVGWCPLKASRGNVGISHLLFTDDLLLFAKVSNEACEAISDVLQEFYSESG